MIAKKISVIYVCAFLASSICFTQRSYAQRNNIDSLRYAAYDITIADSLRLNALQRLAEVIYIRKLPDSANYFATEMYQLAEGLNNKKRMADALNILGVVAAIKNNLDEALKIQNENLQMRNELNDEAGLAQVYGNLANIYRKKGDYPKAVESAKKGLELHRKSNNQSGIASALNNFGLIYMEQGEYTTNHAKQKEYFENAIKYYSESIEIKSSIGDLRGVRNSNNNLAAVYQMLNRNDEALKILLELLVSAQESGELISIGNYNNNIGVVYSSLALESENAEEQLGYRQKAIGHFETGRAIRAELGDTLGLMNSLNNLAITYAEMNVHDKSILLNVEALAMAIEFGSVAEIRDISESLYTSYKATGNYKEALNMFEVFISNRDSINDQGARESLLKHDMEMEFERQKLEDNLRHESDIQKQKNARNLTFAAAGMLFLLLIIFFNRFRLKQKAAKLLEAKNAEVEAARARAVRSESFRKQFLANMSHEIRTPMNAIIGMTRLLKDRRHDAQSLTYLNAVDHAANNLLVVINDVLDLSKLEAGKMEANPHPTHLSAELEMLATTFALRAAEKKLRFELIKPGNLPDYVLIDIARVIQILYNLLGNAIKFTEAGSVRLIINHRNINEERIEITFNVSDTGIGIPPEKQDEIFESFGQGHTHDSRQYGGTGLGLTIARSLVELLGGNLKLESTPGAGSTFSFAIPCTVSSPDQLEIYLSRNTFTLSDRHRSYPILILLADDNEYNRMVAIDTLKKYLPNAEIDATDSATHLLEMLPQKTYDIVLMDVQMPGMDGYDCTRVIRSLADESMRNIHIVAFTASVIRTDIQKCYESGMNGYIPKPFRDEDLLKPITALIDKFPDRISLNKPTAHIELNQNNKLFLKLVPKRLQKVKAALAAGDAGTVKKTIHLMRPQLIDAGMAENTELFEWFEYIDTDNPPEEWIAKTNLFCEKVNNRISQFE